MKREREWGKERGKGTRAKIHEKGKGVAGTYVHEVAEQKAIESTTMARSAGHPLNVTVEAE